MVHHNTTRARGRKKKTTNDEQGESAGEKGEEDARDLSSSNYSLL